MICKPCREGRPAECLGTTRDKTWCDNQHAPSKSVQRRLDITRGEDERD